MADYTIYHNPRCTKSRATLELLREHGIEPTVVEYLKDPPSAAQLKEIVEKLGIEPEALVRKGEDIYKSNYAGRALTPAQWFAAMVQDPVQERLLEIIASKKKGKRPTRAKAAPEPPSNVINIMDALRRSIASEGRGKGR